MSNSFDPTSPPPPSLPNPKLSDRTIVRRGLGTALLIAGSIGFVVSIVMLSFRPSKDVQELDEMWSSLAEMIGAAAYAVMIVGGLLVFIGVILIVISREKVIVPGTAPTHASLPAPESATPSASRQKVRKLVSSWSLSPRELQIRLMCAGLMQAIVGFGLLGASADFSLPLVIPFQVLDSYPDYVDLVGLLVMASGIICMIGLKLGRFAVIAVQVYLFINAMNWIIDNSMFNARLLCSAVLYGIAAFLAFSSRLRLNG